MNIDLDALGISADELIDRVVESIAHNILNDWSVASETGRPHKSFAALLEDRIVDRVNEAINEVAAKNILPNVASYVENLTLQQTNKWGEKIGEPVTFVEYLVGRAEAWITEPVNYEGKPKGANSFGWQEYGTRVSYLIDRHLHFSIETAMKTALSDLNKSVAKGLNETVRIKINEVLGKLKVEVKT